MNIEINKYENYIKIIFPNDNKDQNLKLLVTLSPILIASFDNGSHELEFLRKTIDKSKFAYGLYPKFFDKFKLEDYKNEYKSYKVNEDIYLNNDNHIEFMVNPMEDKYLKGLLAIIDEIILNKNSNDYFTNYFKEIRDDIVINGRRSILANGIQGFYLSKYVVVWMIDLCEYVMKHSTQKKDLIMPIYDLANNLKTPRNL